MERMLFLQRNRFTLLFLALAVFCSVLVLRQMEANRARHLEAREALILLNATGHTAPAQRLYEWLIRRLETASVSTLLEDRQRLAILIDPAKEQPDNLLWKYHRSVANELDKRSQNALVRALKLAEEIR